MERTKLFVVGDAVATTGFARVCHSVLENLPKEKYDISQLGINYYGDPHGFSYKIYPAATGGDIYGTRRLAPLVKSIKPDLIFIVNDPWIINNYLHELKENKLDTIPVVVYFPVDAAEHSPRWFVNFDIVNKVCVYTQFAKNVVLKTGSPNVPENKIFIVPHGITKEHFFPTDKIEARKKIYPAARLNEFLNSFIILNANRNQPRKRMDITAWAFREFQKGKKDVKLYLHMGTQDSGFDIVELAIRYGFSDKLIISANTPTIPQVPKDRLNFIYNATDIGLNTSMGEGWGLVAWEHAATKTPQIMPNLETLKEIWGDSAIYTDTICNHMFPNINTVGKVTSVESVVEKLNMAYDSWKSDKNWLNEYAEKSYNLVTQDKYSWESVSNMFDAIFSDTVEGKV